MDWCIWREIVPVCSLYGGSVAENVVVWRTSTFSGNDLGIQASTDDWVVIYYYDGDHREGQCTVVTETQGPDKGERVVRGREAESRQKKRA